MSIPSECGVGVSWSASQLASILVGTDTLANLRPSWRRQPFSPTRNVPAASGSENALICRAEGGYARPTLAARRAIDRARKGALVERFVGHPLVPQQVGALPVPASHRPRAGALGCTATPRASAPDQSSRSSASHRREPGGTRHAGTGSDDARAWRGVKRSAAELESGARRWVAARRSGTECIVEGRGRRCRDGFESDVRTSVKSLHAASSPPPPQPTSLPARRPPPARPFPHRPSPRERQRPGASPGPP